MKPGNGGPAFPQWDGHAITSEPMYLRGGMSLRDWFAGMALQGMLSANPQRPTGMNERNVDAIMSREAYASADAMLEERAK